MIKGRKRKSTDTTGQFERFKKTTHCSLHIVGTEHDPFTSLAARLNLAHTLMFFFKYIISVTGDLLNLQIQITEWKKVCNKIPRTISEGDHETIGYHRQCYQIITGKMRRLKVTHVEYPEHSTFQRHHSPSKQ